MAFYFIDVILSARFFIDFLGFEVHYKFVFSATKCISFSQGVSSLKAMFTLVFTRWSQGHRWPIWINLHAGNYITHFSFLHHPVTQMVTILQQYQPIRNISLLKQMNNIEQQILWAIINSLNHQHVFLCTKCQLHSLT